MIRIAKPTIKPTMVKNLHICQSSINLAGAEVELVSQMSREQRLKEKVDKVNYFTLRGAVD